MATNWQQLGKLSTRQPPQARAGENHRRVIVSAVRFRRGKFFTSRTSCVTLRIFSANGSRASFWRISNFMSSAISV
jgi:hypothetical protein